MCSHLIFTTTLCCKAHYPHLYSEEAGAWRVLGNLPKVTMLLSRKFKIQTLVFALLNPVFLLPSSATFQRWIGCGLCFQRVLSLVGMKFSQLGEPFGTGRNSPFQLGSWHLHSRELNWDHKNSFLLPVISAPFSIEALAHHKSKEAKWVHLWFHSWHFVSTLEERYAAERNPEVKKGQKRKRGDLGHLDPG